MSRIFLCLTPEEKYAIMALVNDGKPVIEETSKPAGIISGSMLALLPARA
jgi:hypothetical protein